VKNQVTGHFVLNAKSEEAQSKVFIENGLEWEYSLDQEKETLKTTGPLYEAIVVLVSPSSTPPPNSFSPPCHGVSFFPSPPRIPFALSRNNLCLDLCPAPLWA
jgi:hypothetical protein